MRHSDLFSLLNARRAIAAGGALAIAGVAVIAVAGAKPALAACIVDTGPGLTGGGVNFSLDSRQYFAGEFTVAKNSTIDNIMGWLGIGRSNSGGSVRVSLHSDGGDVPGAALFSKSFTPDPNYIAFFPENPDPNIRWQGVSDLNWSVTAGTYWASFVPDQNFSGFMPGGAPMPLDHYASNNGFGGWQPNTSSNLGLGIRVGGEPTSTMASLR